MRPKTLPRLAAIGALAMVHAACLDLGLSPAVGGVLQSVVVEGEALPEFARTTGGNGTAQVSGFIVGRLRCDTIDGDVEERNSELAEQQLELARERYQLGAITFVELMDAQTLSAQADSDRIGAVFAYHDSVTQLEALIGASLRFEGLEENDNEDDDS